MQVSRLQSVTVCVLVFLASSPVLGETEQEKIEENLHIRGQSSLAQDENLAVFERIKVESNEPKGKPLGHNSGLGPVACVDENCNGRGYCDYEVGECRCRGGWIGPSCETSFFRTCENGHSRCPGRCDEEVGFCYCGYNTSHPERVLPFHCKPVGFHGGNVPVEDLFGKLNPKTKQAGWCEAPSHYPEPPSWLPAQETARRCPCVVDGHGGEFCDTPHMQFCLNDCSGNGECLHGYCKCEKGFFGEDCSITVEKLIRFTTGQTKSPKIYVYSMPQDFTGHQLVYRVDKGSCVPYFYNEFNQSSYGSMYYSMEVLLHEYLLSSPHRTLDPDEADFFFIPVYSSCHIYPVWRFGKDPDYAKGCPIRIVSAMRLQKMAFDYVRTQFPYFNRTQGQNHMIMALHDEGACWMNQDLYENVIVLAHWGNSVNEPYSTTAYPADRWDGDSENCPTLDKNKNPIANKTSADEIGKHRCFTPEKDIVIPSWRIPQAVRTPEDCGKMRENKVYFAGNWGEYRDPRYSMGIRQKIFALYNNTAGWKLLSRTENYRQDLCNSVFCLVLPGDGWSSRFEDSVTAGCIPLIVQDNVYVPYEGWLDISSIALRVSQDDIEKLPAIVDAVPQERITELLRNSALAAKYFKYTTAWKTEEQDYNIFAKNSVGEEDVITPDNDARFLSAKTINAKEGDDMVDALDFLLRILALKSAQKTPLAAYSTL